MRINPTVILTLLLLGMMFGAGATSAKWGLTLGTQALKEISQPEISPTRNRKDNEQALGKGDAISFFTEEQIIERVKAIQNGNIPEDSSTEKKAAEKKPDKPSSEPQKAAEPKKAEGKFPFTGKDKDVILSVHSVQKQEDWLIIDVSLKNDSNRSVQFLYSFLNVTDERGRVLSATTEGLPGELPANQQKYSGTIKISTALLDDAEKLSLTLTDYPDQKLQLQISDLPVVK
jgi:hypothetical protein